MIAIVGCAGSGKTRIAKSLENEFGMLRIVTYTDREPREGEINGVDYNFLDKDKMKQYLSCQFFVEHTMYNGFNYGSSFELADEKRTVAILTPSGLSKYKELLGDKLYSVYIDIDERSRAIGMLKRGDSVDMVFSRILNDRNDFTYTTNLITRMINNNGYGVTSAKLAEKIFNDYANYYNEVKK